LVFRQLIPSSVSKGRNNELSMIKQMFEFNGLIKVDPITPKSKKLSSITLLL